MEQNNNASDTGENTPETAAAPQAADDPIKNLKAEMNRKLENTNAQLQALLTAINQQNKPAASEPVKKVSVFEDEDAYAARIKAETAAEIKAELARQQAQQAKQAQTINNLVMDFPELSQLDHPLTKRAVEIFESLPEDEKQSSLAYKAAVKEAALELDVKPKSKRAAKKEDDSFSLGGGSSAGKRPPAATDMDKAREAFAEKLGLKLTPEVKERLKQHAKKDFKRFS